MALLGALIAFGACNRDGKQPATQVDTTGAAQRRADSLAAAEAEAARLAALEAEQEQERLAALERERAASLKFHVIIGGFVIQSNADGYLNQMKRTYPDAKIFVAPNGFKLVSIGDFDSYESAIAMIRGIWQREGDLEERTDLWVYEEGGKYDTSSWLENRDGDGYYEYGGGGGETAYDFPPDEFDD